MAAAVPRARPGSAQGRPGSARGRPGSAEGQATNAAGPLAPAAPAARQRVWDLPTRAFHWLLVLAVGTAIATAQRGGEWMVWHGRAGLAVAGLLAFRLVWGLWGPGTARFASFAPTPARLRAYLRGQWHGVGHNPLGALSVFALLALLAAQAASGVFSNDDIAYSGALASRVADSTSAWLTGWHHRCAYALYGLAGLHVAAIGVYLLRRHDLLTPMITGYRQGPAEGGAAAATATEPARARAYALPLGLAAALVAVLAGNGVLPWPRLQAEPDATAAATADTATAEANAAPQAAPAPVTRTAEGARPGATPSW